MATRRSFLPPHNNVGAEKKKIIYQGLMRIKAARGRRCWKQMLASPLVAVLVHGRAFLVFLFKLLTDSFGSSALISLRTPRLLSIAAWTPCLIVHNSFWLGIAWPRLQGVTNSPYTGDSGCAQWWMPTLSHGRSVEGQISETLTLPLRLLSGQ